MPRTLFEDKKSFIKTGITEDEIIDNRPKLLFAKIEAPTYSSDAMIQAFGKVGYNVIQFDWQRVRFTEGLHGMRDRLLIKAQMEEPEVIFLHLQNEAAADTDFIFELRKYGFIVNYTFDVRSKKETQWMYDLAPHIGLTLFACMEDVNECRESGINNVALMQSSCNMDWYRKLPVQKSENKLISFIGNNNVGTNLNFELAKERQSMIKFLSQNYPISFTAYGLGQDGKMVNPQEEINIYNYSAIAISQNNFDRELYTSDRLWRIMACGCFCLTKYFKGIETIFERGVHLDWWADLHELKEKIDYYLENDEERNKIAETGATAVRSRYTWVNRFEQMNKLITFEKGLNKK